MTWLLRGKFAIKLLNQISDCEHHSDVVIYDERADNDTAGRVTNDNSVRIWEKSKFISNENLHKVTTTCQYLKDDCISSFKLTNCRLYIFLNTQLLML